MVFVETPARFTPILEFGVVFREIPRYPPKTRHRGALAPQIRIRRNGFFGARGPVFEAFMILPGRPRFRAISGYWETQGIKPLAAGGIFADI